MSIYDVFNGGSKPFDKAEWAAQKQFTVIANIVLL